jgi:hypothetical protein
MFSARLSLLGSAMVMLAVGCSSGGPTNGQDVASEGALRRQQSAPATPAALLDTALHTAWDSHGWLNGRGEANGALTDGSGFQGYTAEWSTDAVPSYDVSADFEVVLIVRKLGCSKAECASITIGEKGDDGKYVIKQAQSKDAPPGTDADPDKITETLWVTSRENLEATLHSGARRDITRGGYSINEVNLE